MMTTATLHKRFVHVVVAVLSLTNVANVMAATVSTAAGGVRGGADDSQTLSQPRPSSSAYRSADATQVFKKVCTNTNAQ